MQPLASRRAWRVRGVPLELDKTRLAHILQGHPDLHHLNKRAPCFDNNGNGAIVHTLARDHLRAHEQVATVRFPNLPCQLEAKGQLQITINTDLNGRVPLEDEDGGQGVCPARVTIDEQFEGITTLFSPLINEHQIDLLAVSGLGSHAFGSFVSKEDGNMWLADNIERDLPAARVMIYGYESGLQNSTSFVQFPDLASPLLTAINQILASDQKKPIILIGHSLGGLLVKQALIASSEDVLDMVRGILLFGTPNDGMDTRSLVPIVRNQPNRFLLDSLNPMNSQVLRHQREEFPRVLNRINHRLFCFYETELSPTAAEDPRTGRYKMSGPSQCLVSQFSATSCLPAGYAYNCMAIRRTHSELVKFSFHDTEYDKVFHILARLQELSRSHNDVSQRPKSATAQHNTRPAHLAIDRLIQEDQVIQTRKRPAENSHQSSKRPRASSSSTEAPPSPPCEPRASNTPSQNNMGDLKDLLIDMLYFEKIDERLTHLTPAQGTTCRWFLTKPEYLAWHNPLQRSDHGGLLLIWGNPGTGKSTLMKLLFETAKLDEKRNPAQITLSFFFLARGVVEEKTTTGLYRSLLHQIFEKAPESRDSLDWMTIDGARTIQRNGWQDEALKQILTQAVQRLGQRSISIFVDALDECNQDQAESMIFLFEELCHRAIEAHVDLKVCFSSRHYPTIVIHRGIEIILEDATGHADDIRQFIKSRLRLGNSKQVEVLRSEILEKSSGIFLWVVLVIDILNSDKSMPIRKIRENLRTIPPGLNELFNMILDRGTENLQELQLCLQWILFAIRPLRAQELYFAIQLGCDRECSGEWDQDDINMESMKIFVRRSSKGLAEITRNKASEVQFIHESVRDFLLGRYESQWSGAPGNFLGYSHELLRKICVAQIVAPISLQFDIPEPLPRGRAAGQLRDAVALRFPFLQYAIFSIFYHANAAEYNGRDQLLFLAEFPLQIWVHLRNAFERYDSRRYTKTVTLLYILAEKNFAELIRIYSKRNACFEVENERCITPALAALATGSWEAVQAFSKAHAECQPPTSPIHRLCESDLQKDKILIEAKALAEYKLNSFQSQNISNYLAMLGNESIVFAFLLSSPDSELNGIDEAGRTPLCWAAERGHEAVVELLLEKGAHVNFMDISGLTPIWLAAENGHEAIMKLLLDKGADINPQDRIGKTPLWFAIGSVNRYAIQLLLKNGADIEWKNLRGQTPLLYACYCGHEDVVKLLLEHGANIESQDDRGWTALWHALDDGDYKCIETLLKNGANIESKDSSSRTPLSWAATCGTADIIRLLIEKGANLESKDSENCTPLFSAVKRRDPGAIKVFLVWKADMLSKNEPMGQTPSGLAVELRNEAIIGLFLERLVAELPEKGKEKLPPGWWFVDGGRLIIAALLPKDEITWLLSAIATRLGVIPSLLPDEGVGLSSQVSWTRLLWFVVAKTDATRTMDFWLHKVASLSILPFTPLPDLYTMLTIIIGQGADLQLKDTTGRTLLSWAVTTVDKMAVIELLLDKGAALESKDSQGRTPLSWTVTKHGNVSVVELLLKRGADIEVKDDDGRTPLNTASRTLGRYKDNAVVALLLEYGADVAHRDNSGQGRFVWLP